MITLGIETSCDETAVAVVKDREILSSIISSQEEIHAPYGGVVPELASRNHLEKISLLFDRALEKAEISSKEIDGVAATCAPGLVGALLVGLSFGKALAFALQKPFIGVNHLEGHLNSPFLESPDLQYPFLALVVSGGHTSLYVVHDFGKYERVGSTRDDAAGEAYDKVAKILGLGYPGGPLIDKLARQGNPKAFKLPIPNLGKNSLEFSFSGIKTAVMLVAKEEPKPLSPKFVQDMAASFQETVTNILIDRAQEAAQRFKQNRLVIAGGVAANQGLREKLDRLASEEGLRCFIPSMKLCTDNAAMIAYVGGQHLKRGQKSAWNLNATATQELGL